jgi:folate-dependent phosphoribosylglycinamide formyltransferase PurN
MMKFIIEEKLVVITNGNYFARLILEAVLTQWAENILGVLIVTGDYQGRTNLKALWELSKVTAWPYLAYKLFSLMTFRTVQHLYPDAVFGVRELVQRQGIPWMETPSVKLTEAIDWIRSKSPDLIVSVSCPQMIGKAILSSARLGGINIHTSRLPAYAGLAPYHWVLSQGEKETGVTVHFMKLRFDEGKILKQSIVPIEAGESAFHLFTRLAKIGGDILPQAIQMAMAGEAGWQQDMRLRTYFSHPTIASYKSLRRNGHCLIRPEELLAVVRSEILASGSTA